MTNDDIIQAARSRMADAYEYDLPNRDRDLNDRRFVIGEQWPEEVRRERDAEGKPCLTINGMPQYVRQVTAQIRNLNPAIKVDPADGLATKDVAEIYAGLMRHIEQKCDASSIYEHAAESAATGGIGYFRVRTDYCDDESFDQEILIERIPNPFAVFFDPLARDLTRKDARYCFIAEEVDLEEFKRQYPDATPSDVTSDHRPPGFEQWHRNDNVVVAEYFWIEHEEYTLYQTPDGIVTRQALPAPVVARKRKVRSPRVKWAKVGFNDVLEGPIDIPCRYIPVFAVPGEEIHIGEEVYRSGVIRFAKDPQMLYNYARSAQAELISLQPKAPFMVTVKQIAGLEAIWAQANSSNRPYLVYTPDEKAGPPSRVMPPVTSEAWMTEAQMAAEDMKRTTGIYDAALGAKSNETSGIAIQRRQQESQASTSIYADNMVKAIVQCGNVLVDMIPRVYDTQRVIRIMGEDDQEKMVLINAVMNTQDGPEPYNDLTQGKYDVRVSVGPAYATRRQEAQEGMMSFLAAVPQAAAVTADLVAGAQEWPDADKFAKRLKKTLPPGVIDADELEPEEQQEMQMQQQQMQQQQEMQAQQEQAMMQQAQQMEMAKAQAEIRKAEAMAEKAEADALKARIEAQRAAIEAQAMGLMQTGPQIPY